MAAPLKPFPMLPAVVAKRYDQKGGARDGEAQVTLKGKLPPWAVLVIIALGGTVFLIGGNVEWGIWGDKSDWAHGLARDVGIALATTAVLGFTVDRWLKLEIAVDVFKAALGYVLPEEFREEIRRISNYKWICEKHLLIVQIDRLDPDTVKATIMVERTIKNISSGVMSFQNVLDIDEFGFPNAKSEILECSLQDEAGNTRESKETKHNGHWLHAETEEIKLPLGSRVTIKSKYCEIRRSNDHVVFVAKIPTKAPEIEVRIPDDFAYKASFGHPDEVVEKAAYANRFTMLGTYFPNQVMRVRWWLKA